MGLQRIEFSLIGKESSLVLTTNIRIRGTWMYFKSHVDQNNGGIIHFLSEGTDDGKNIFAVISIPY